MRLGTKKVGSKGQKVKKEREDDVEEESIYLRGTKEMRCRERTWNEGEVGDGQRIKGLEQGGGKERLGLRLLGVNLFPA